MFPLLVIASVVLYLTAGAGFAYRLYRGIGLRAPGQIGLVSLGLAAAFVHAIVLYSTIFRIGGVDLGVFTTASLVLWLAATVLLLATLHEPLGALCAAVLPLAAVALGLEAIFPESHIIERAAEPLLNVHILISVVSYSLLSLAAAQAGLVALQNTLLHQRHPGGFIRVLPPLESMEALLFRLILAGFVLLTLSLISGVVFIDNMFAQHLAHKTVLSITAWLVFAVLLWGRWRFGWRGRIAIRWTLGGIVVLLLAYFGSKIVLEVVLGESW